MSIAAIDAAAEGRWTAARQLCRDAEPVVAGTVLFVTRDYHRALSTLSGARGGRAEWLTYDRAARIGWDDIAAAALAASLARDPNNPRLLAAGLSLHARAGDLEVARAHGRALLAIEPDSKPALAQMAALAALGGDRQEAKDFLARSGAPERLLAVERDDVDLILRGLSMFPVQRVNAALAALGTAGEQARANLDAWRFGAPPPRRDVFALEKRDVATWLELVLSYIEIRDERRARAAAERAELEAPALVSDAARACGVELRGDHDRRAPLDALFAVFEHALASMKGNRSAMPTYVTPEGLLRVSRRLVGEERAQSDLAEARAWIARTPARVSPPKTLTDEQIERFIEDGYVCLRSALPAETIVAWQRNAEAELLRGLRDGSLKIVATPDGVARDPRAFDPDDPDTWPSGTAVLTGSRKGSIAELAPQLFGAICQLVGDERRLATRDLSDYLIVRFPDGERERDGQGWHIDDPGPAMSLRNLRNGLVLLILFSEVAADGGATMLATDSVPHVARILAKNPGGTDFTGAEIGRSIAAQCTETVRCYGGPGDVFITHPLLVHRATANLQPRLRWMSNLMLYLNESLSVDGASPVEQAIARALHSAATKLGPAIGSSTE